MRGELARLGAEVAPTFATYDPVGERIRPSWFDLSGVWVQLSSEGRVRQGAVLDANRFFGAAAAHGGRLALDGATISNTVAEPWDGGTVGDGVAALDGGKLYATGLNLVDNARSGIFAHAPSAAEFHVSNSSAQGGQYALVVQAKPSDAQWEVPGAAELSAAGASVQSYGTDLGLVVRSTVCAGADCVPH